MVTFPENYYSFRKTETVLGSIFHPRTPDQAALADIESTLTEANNEFLARQYLDAIKSYQAAQAKIYAQLDPGFFGNIFNISELPVHSVLFAPLLSASSEWLNIVPVQQAAPSVRPRVAIDPATIASIAERDKTGVMSAVAVTPAAQNTVADWQMARRLQDRGFSKSAEYFLNRAAQSDAQLFAQLNAGQRLAGAATAAVTTAAATVSGSAGLGSAAEVMNVPGLSFTEYSGAAQRAALPAAVAEPRTLGVLVNDKAVQFQWTPGEGPPIQQIEDSVYRPRITAKVLPDALLWPLTPADVALSLPHAYYYVVPLGLAECYHALGDYATAETYYFQAASYQYLNQAIEAPYLWQRLATLYLDWGNSLFRTDDAQSALAVYQNVLKSNDQAPSSKLYTTVSLKPGADQGLAVIAKLGDLSKITSSGLNLVTAAVIVEIKGQLRKIAAGLDYWGFSLTNIPIWTFDYLQSVAVNFAQLAISAERDVIDFRDRADQGTLTRQQLTENVQQSQAEVQAAQMQQVAAVFEAGAYNAGLTLANQRSTDAQQNAATYANDSALAIQYQAAQSQTAGGDDGDPNQLNGLADQLMSGQTIHAGHATLSGAYSLTASRYNRDYEVAALQSQAQEMKTAAVQAQAEAIAAAARVDAAAASTAVANLRAQAAQQDLSVFNAQTFTPDVWSRMGDQMWRLYQRYQTMALRAARLMQLAYNFETDQSLKLIKGDYSTDEVKGLLGADALMADIQSFTYDLITSTATKPQPIKQTISLAQQYGYLFETQFRKTGSMDFETRIEDFDSVYPGTYAGRIEAIEVEVDGIVPVTGISGSLTNNGISSYRLPAALTPPASTGLKYRVQSKETLVLSDYVVRTDAPLVTQDTRMMRIFQGAGVASSWRLDLPKAINDIDYGALTDVRLIFYYKARFDPDLRATVLAKLAGLPGVNGRQRSLPTRWVYPDAFFRFQATGNLDLSLKASDFRANETQPVITSIGLLVTTDGTVPAKNLTVSLSTPTHAAISAQTNADGIIDGSTGAWTPLAAGTAIGAYRISVAAAGNPQLVSSGKLSLGPIVNLSLIFGYSYTPKA